MCGNLHVATPQVQCSALTNNCAPQVTTRCAAPLDDTLLIKSMAGFDHDCALASAASMPWQYGEIAGGRTVSVLPNLHPAAPTANQTGTLEAGKLSCSHGGSTIKTAAGFAASGCDVTLAPPVREPPSTFVRFLVLTLPPGAQNGAPLSTELLDLRAGPTGRVRRCLCLVRFHRLRG